MQEENIVKSIIYGSPISTTYGMLRSLCSAINHRDHIDKIIFYLRTSDNFKKYNKFAHNPTFVTEDRHAGGEKFIEGYNDDTGLQGNGEKLLNLLKKFNVRNVLVIVTIRQKDPLKEFNSEHYVQVVKCAKDLLSSLYDKVILSKDVPSSEKAELEYEPLAAKQFQIPLGTYYQKEKLPSNPNYVGLEFAKKIDVQPHKKLKAEMEFLNEKIQELANKLEDVIEDFQEVEDSQIEFAIRYDQSRVVVKVFELLAQLFGLPSKDHIMREVNSMKGQSKMSSYLRSITMRSITSERIRTLNQQLLSNQKLKSSEISKENQICGMVMQFIEILLKSYSFARRLALIEAEIEEDEQEKNTSRVAESQRALSGSQSELKDDKF